ncbi:SdpI family protein [Spirosoma koreense]
MKTESYAPEMLMIGTLLTPFAYAALIWQQLPTEVAIHYTLTGNPDGWMPKETVALLLGVVSVMSYVLLRFLPAIDPKGRLQSVNFVRLRYVITLTVAAIVGWVWYMAAHQKNQPESLGLLLAITGLMLAGIGNYLTTVRPNWFVGIRTPWTLASEVVWRKTHRLGGRLMVFGGLVAAILALVVPIPYRVGSVVTVMLATALIPVIYSYISYQQEKAHPLNG